MSSTVILESVSPQISILTLNRPEKRNALNLELLEAFQTNLQAVIQNQTKRVLILKGNGPVFCTGMDLSEASDPSIGIQSAEKIAQTFTALYNTPLITIAAVHGAAMGGGAGLMNACDLAIASDNTQIGYPEVRRGLVAAQVLAFLMRQLKPKNIKELLLTGELISSQKAQEMGLINQIVPPQSLLETALKMAEAILKGAPQAIIKTKKLINSLYPVPFEQDLLTLLQDHREMRVNAEALEGIQAFLEKREPQWN